MTDPESVRTVTVTVHPPPASATGPRPAGGGPTAEVPPSGEAAAVLHVRLEDISVADRPSRVLAVAHVPVPDAASGEPVTVTLEVPAGDVDERDSYSVFAHLDVTGSGEVSQGDALTTQTYPVLTFGAPDDVDVDLRRI